MTSETSSLSRTPSSALRRPRSANPALSERCSRLCKNNNVESSQQSKNKIGQHFDAEVNEMKIAQTPPDAKLNSHAAASAAVADAKARAVAGHLQRSDSSSSLRKSESVNIFARNNDPFDDDFFCEESSSHKSKEKFSKSNSNESKWAESFSAFSFDSEPQ